MLREAEVPGARPPLGTWLRYQSRLSLRRCREIIGDHPAFLPLVLACTPEGRSRAITADTDVVVEGFPRCGNTFAAAALQLCAPSSDISIVSRVHVPAQVKKAVRHGIPTVLVIRDPAEAVASLALAAPHVTLEHGLREFVHHYEQLWPYRESVVVAPFDDVTADFGSVVRELNEKFGTSFHPFVHSEETERAAFALMEERNGSAHHGAIRARYDTRPSAERTAAKQSLLAKLRSDRMYPLLERAEGVYAGYMAVARS